MNRLRRLATLTARWGRRFGAHALTGLSALSATVAVVALACLAPRVWAQTAAEAAAVTTAPTAQPATPVPPALEFKVDVINPEDLLDHNKTLVVPTLMLSLLTDGGVTAVKQSGLFQSGSATARASAKYSVKGLDKAFAQQLAQAAYDDFVAQLRQAGYTVLTYADIKEREPIKAAQRETNSGAMGLPTSSEAGNNYVIAAPSDEQHFKSSLAGGLFSEFISGGKSRMPDATIVIPQYTIQAPQAWAEGGRGYKSVSAEANVAPGMNLLIARATWLGAPKSRMMRGIPGVASKGQVINATDNAGTLAQTADTTPQAANVLSSALSLLSGAGNIQRKSTEYALSIDRAAYTAGVMNAVRGFNAEVAKAAAAAKP